MIPILKSALDVFVAMAPYLLLGFALAGILYVLVPRSWVSRHLGGRGWRAVIKGALVGIPLPLCSCGIIPFASSLQKQGAGRGPTTSFLIATPQTGVDSILVTYSFLGLPFAAFRVVAALVTGMVGGLLASALDGTSRSPTQPDAAAPPRIRGWVRQARAAARFGLVETVGDVAGWLVVGVLLAGVIHAVLPPESLSPAVLGGTLISMLAVVAVALPMYVCATASVPIAAALVAKGMPLGAALVFLVAGPATNAATLSVFARTLGKRIAAVYAGTIVVCSVLLGWAFEALTDGWDLAAAIAHHHAEAAPWWAVASALVLAALLTRTFIVQARERLGRKEPAMYAPAGAPMIRLQVDGMTCQNCRRHVETTLRKAAPECQIQVDLLTGNAEVWGCEPDPAELARAVTDAGYPAEAVGVG